jgi:hypothetical protein
MTNMPRSARETGVVLVAAGLSHELLELLRQRIATHFYDDARVIDDIARAIACLPIQFM